MLYFNNSECMEREARRLVQLERLKKQIRNAYDNVPMYKKKFEEAGIVPEDIRELGDLKIVPFTVKDDFRANYPFGIFGVPMDKIVRLHASSGTTGKPVVVGYTKDDLDMWDECMARTLTAGGVTKEDIVQVTFGYGLFTGGFGAHGGSQRLGSTTIPMSSGNTKKQIMIMQDFGSTVLCCTPSYALQIAETAAGMGIDPKTLPIKRCFLGAEPWTEAMRNEIEERLGVKAYNIFGLTEVLGPGVAYECFCQNGMHVNEDFFIAEIVDPKTFEPLPEGEPGELVFTTLTKQGVPVLRYRTKDITSISYEKCPCGRTSGKMARIMGRTDDMLIIRGVNVFPGQIEEILLNIEGVEPQYLIILDRENSVSDNFEILVEVSEGILQDEVRAMENLQKRILSEIHSVIGLNPKIRLVEPYTIERSEGKVKRVIDRRELYNL
ncbi:MAG: phenylacetate--CoA ligase [Armatimonadetes bacterium]|nr:phenylacetate--CoA ligase [Candidatus Hippobium faecium]